MHRRNNLSVWVGYVWAESRFCSRTAVQHLTFFDQKHFHVDGCSWAPSSITVRGCEWRWFRHLGTLRTTLGSPWNHITAQVTYEFVAFRFLHSSGTKWSLNLVIWPMCPPIALLDLELGNYTSGQRGERRGFVISRGADERRQFGWRNHGANINFSVFTTVSQQDVP